MKILGLDISTNVGAALYAGGDPASIQCEGWQLNKQQLAQDIESTLGVLLERWQPDVVLAEAPLAGLVFYRKKGDLAGPQLKTGMSTSALLLNRIAGMAEMCIRMHGIAYEEVEVRTWQGSMLKGIPGETTKDRAKVVCELCKIKEAGNEHKRDAALIALWGWAHSQQKRWLENARTNSAPLL